MAAEGDDGVGGMVTIYCGEAGRYLHRRPFGSKKRSTKSTSRIPTQKSKDASRTAGAKPQRRKSTYDGRQNAKKNRQTKYPIGRTQLASIRTKPTLIKSWLLHTLFRPSATPMDGCTLIPLFTICMGIGLSVEKIT